MTEEKTPYQQGFDSFAEKLIEGASRTNPFDISTEYDNYMEYERGRVAGGLQAFNDRVAETERLIKEYEDGEA